MKTAVEWLEKKIKEFNTVITKEYLLILIEQAKEMEKEQIIYSNYNGQSVVKKLKDINIHQMKNKAEQYYNETYKTKTIVTEFRDGSVKVETFKSE